MFVLIVKMCLSIPESQSLKDKRMVVRSISGKLKTRYKVSFAETGENHKWQRAEIGIAIVSGNYTYLDLLENTIRYFISDNFPIEILEWDFEILKK